jgi:hypothetical protein
VGVEGVDAAQVEDGGGDPFVGELVGGLQASVDADADADEPDVGAGSAQCGLAEGRLLPGLAGLQTPPKATCQ